MFGGIEQVHFRLLAYSSPVFEGTFFGTGAMIPQIKNSDRPLPIGRYSRCESRDES